MDFATHHRIYKYITDWVNNKRTGETNYYEICAAIKLHFDLSAEETENIVREWINARREAINTGY